MNDLGNPFVLGILLVVVLYLGVLIGLCLVGLFQESRSERTTEVYDLPGRCLNCGARFVVWNRKGDRPPLSVECPACGVREFSWKGAAR